MDDTIMRNDLCVYTNGVEYQRTINIFEMIIHKITAKNSQIPRVPRRVRK